jgi:hypothetical protein
MRSLQAFVRKKRLSIVGFENDSRSSFKPAGEVKPKKHVACGFRG